jgi:predicted regulator of Ras-like GTPase activity (Roadblock/LC7/MglB family)
VAGTEDPVRLDPLKQALGEYLRIPGMRAAMLVSDQGLTISSVTRDEVDAASIAALVLDTVATAQRFGLQVQAGFLDTLSIEFEKMTVILAPFTPDVMLALIADPGSASAPSIGEPGRRLGSESSPSG